MINRIFVYGTLRNPNSPDFIEKATIQGQIFSAPHGNFPLVILKGNQEVTGEVHRIGNTDKEIKNRLKYLDRYEGVPNLYVRETVKVNRKDTFIYVAGPNLLSRLDNCKPIPSGDWKDR